MVKAVILRWTTFVIYENKKVIAFINELVLSRESKSVCDTLCLLIQNQGYALLAKPKVLHNKVFVLASISKHSEGTSCHNKIHAGKDDRTFLEKLAELVAT